MTTGLQSSGLIRLFARHPNASNLAMVIMIVLGLLSLQNLNTQLFPTINIPVITVKVLWPGASAEDVETSILKNLEPELRFIDGLDDITSIAREGSGFISMEFKGEADMTRALSNVEMAVGAVTTLPKDAEKPTIRRIARYEGIAKLLVTGDLPEATLKAYARDLRDGLLEAGIDHVTLEGARPEEILVETTPYQLRRLNLTVSDIAAKIKSSTQDRPSGTLEGAVDKQIRAKGTADNAQDLSRIEVMNKTSGERVLLSDIANVRDAFDEDAVSGIYKGKLAIQLNIQRTLNADALETNKILDAYLLKIRPELPAGLKLIKYRVRAQHLINRINLLLKNGAGGLALVLIILFIFLNARIAFWVALGIPVAMMGTVIVMFVSGQSINMVSLFAMILTLGIIVDDAIVVGEHTATRSEMGDSALDAAERGASRMLAPVMAATLTTMAAFLPTFFISGRIGQVMLALPLVVISVLIASLVECFLILPGHLRHSIKHAKKEPSRFRRWFDSGFGRFRDGPFKAFVKFTYIWRYTTIAATNAVLIITIGFLMTDRIKFHFFPQPPTEILRARIVMGAGTPRAQTIKAVEIVEAALAKAEEKLGKGEKLVVSSFAKLGKLGYSQGNNLAQIDVQLTATETRTIHTDKIIKGWRKALPKIPGAERISVGGRRSGPSGRDLDIRLSGKDIGTIKKAALELEELMESYPGVQDTADDLPFGKQDIIISLTARGAALGFTTQSIGEQLRNAFEGAIARRFARNAEEVTIRVLRKMDAQGIQSLRDLYLKSPAGAHVPLLEIVDIREKSGFSIINRRNGKNVIAVTADIDLKVSSGSDVQKALESSNGLPEIARKYDITYRFAGRSEDRRAAFANLKLGGGIALVLIFIILAWVFASYTRPFIVMIIIPFGIIGAILGHLAMGFALTILSIIGVLGLAGIIVNDSIILVSQVDERLGKGQSMEQAAVGAAQDRLRAVLLTSLTTIGGLMPLMFETSLQAQYLLPIAITMVFGLAVSTVLVLVIVPASLGVLDDLEILFGKKTRQDENQLLEHGGQ